ncbi:unnamed protein product, partial [Iphiclides podalirius]
MTPAPPIRRVRLRRKEIRTTSNAGKRPPFPENDLSHPRDFLSSLPRRGQVTLKIDGGAIRLCDKGERPRP